MNELSSSNSLFSKSTVSYVIAMVVCALVISFIDSQLPQGVSVGEAYALLVLIGLMAKDSRMVTVGAIVGTVLTLEGFYISEHGVALWIVWTNRLLAIFIIWVIAVFAHSQIRFFEEQKESEKMKKAYELLQQETSYSKLLKDIAILSNSSDPVEEALKQSMQKICDFTGWPVAHIYIKNADEDMLRSSKMWVLADWEKFKDFKKETEATDFRPGVGLPGRVLSKQEVSAIKDLSKDSNFPRARIALANGLKSGFAFPVLIGRRIMAVMEFYSEEVVEEDSRLIDFAGTLGFLLGRPFERDHAGLRKDEYENHLRRLYTRMKAVREEEESLDNLDIHDNLT
jgi:GAF domain-containing protein